VVTHVGLSHSAPITGIAISPDQKSIVSISSDGAIHCWSFLPRKLPTPDVTDTCQRLAEAQLSPIYDDEGDHKLVADDADKEFARLLETKANAIMPVHSVCASPQL
jgi:WD40 repeat protein